MRKIFLLLILFLTIKGYGQTYTMELLFQKSNIACNEVSWSLSDYIMDDYITIGSKTFTDIPNYETFKLSSNFMCPVITPTPACERVSIYDDEKTAIQLIKGYSLSIIGCYVNIRTTNFKPNGITVNRIKTTNVCAGEEVELQALTPSINKYFPSEAYHWQYSLDNQATWVDLPTPYNDRHNNLFTIQEILGVTHDQYYNKQIYFRLGYGQNRPFTEPLAITYSPCAPEIHLVDAPNPLCNESPIPDVTISFKRDLKDGELLKYLCIVKSTDDASILYQHPSDINHFEGALPYKTFTITGLSTLENSGSYRIKYQAFEGTVNKGIQYSEPFTYTIPTPLKYAIDNWTQPSCFGSNDGSIEIQVSGATAPYNFYKDNVKITPAIENGKYYLSGLTAKSEGYKIIVTDKNGCYEKK